MNSKHELHVRIHQLLSLVYKEDQHLMAVRQRFFNNHSDEQVTTLWLEQKLATNEGIDQLESFVGKFTRMQDSIMDKLVPLCLKGLAEPVASAIDNLNRMEKLGLVDHANDWVELRYLRNRLVHEYLEDYTIMTTILNRAKELTLSMHHTYLLLQQRFTAE